jgi:MoaA/NifB/PqqE/SkfB family radical SAM enzyme
VRERGVPYSHIITNGTVLTGRTIGKILDAEISRLTFSIDGGTKETYEAIRIGACFENVIRNIQLFQAMRDERGAILPQLRINHVLTRWNIDRFYDDFFFRMIDKRVPPSGGS